MNALTISGGYEPNLDCTSSLTNKVQTIDK